MRRHTSFVRSTQSRFVSRSRMRFTRVSGAPCGRVLRADKTGIYIAAGEGGLRVTELQFAGGKMLRAADAVNGRKVAVGDLFGDGR